ncbi:MAG: hypothetical protein PHF86_08730 [Candidatus Nanoarchaeia archaeon]|jgi:hypothetical protein|nr:hypothetical protein [Candidatus Nanoarchaeia archaeon]
MTWKLFDQPYRRKIAIYTVRLTPQEKLFLSRSIILKLQLRNDHVAQVWFDSETKEAGVTFGLTFDKSPLSIRGLNQKNAYLNVRGFFKFFGLKQPAKDIKVQAEFKCKTLVFKLP